MWSKHNIEVNPEKTRTKCRLKHTKGTRAKEYQPFDQISSHLQLVSSIFKVCASKSVYLYKKPLLSKGI